MTCPKCASTEIRLRGGAWRVWLGHLRGKYHYSCRRCLIYWSSAGFVDSRGERPDQYWCLRRWARQLGRLGCLVGLHQYGGMRRNPEGGGRMRSCRRCNHCARVD